MAPDSGRRGGAESQGPHQEGEGCCFGKTATRERASGMEQDEAGGQGLRGSWDTEVRQCCRRMVGPWLNRQPMLEDTETLNNQIDKTTLISLHHQLIPTWRSGHTNEIDFLTR